MPGVDTTIGSNVRVDGSLKNLGSIEINGTVEGEIHSEEDVIVGETAKIKGPISAKNVTISGEINGTIEALERLEIMPQGKVYGDIVAATLIIQQGAQFVGKSSMPATETKSRHLDEAPVELIEEKEK